MNMLSCCTEDHGALIQAAPRGFQSEIELASHHRWVHSGQSSCDSLQHIWVCCLQGADAAVLGCFCVFPAPLITMRIILQVMEAGACGDGIIHLPNSKQQNEA